jgi:hypothetical protein
MAMLYRVCESCQRRLHSHPGKGRLFVVGDVVPDWNRTALNACIIQQPAIPKSLPLGKQGEADETFAGSGELNLES